VTVFQNANRGTGRLAREWRASSPMGGELDVVVWLDAPDTVLAQRIRKRRKRHDVKNGTDGEVTEFLSRYRSAYRTILDHLRAAGRVRIVEIQTNENTTDRIAEDILVALGHGKPRNGAVADL
jgi:thymidylate kinase